MPRSKPVKVHGWLIAAAVSAVLFLAPLPAPAIEQFYSRWIFPWWQAGVTRLSNLAPFALLGTLVLRRRGRCTRPQDTCSSIDDVRRRHTQVAARRGFVLRSFVQVSREPFPALHQPDFDFNDEAMPVGVEMLCRVALCEP